MDLRYNTLGEVTGGGKVFTSGSVAIHGYQFGYQYDDIGNRVQTSNNGQNSTYIPNALNQYAQRDVPGVADILGSAHPEATVTINDTATQRQNGLFYRQFGVNNTGGPVLLTATTTGVRKGAGADGKDVVTQTVGSLYVPQTPEVYAYDDDGNLTQDGRWIYTWDGENRLVAMEAISAVPVAAKMKLEFAYSAEGKRIQKKVSLWDIQSGTYQLASEKRFVYDGWNVIAEMDATNTVERSYLWGQDLSGTLQGAGGVGGLLAVTTTGTNSGTYLASTDANGNVLGLVDSQGTVVATYEYGPFGEPLRVSGAMAAQNPFRFSTKYTDDETGLVYYGYRFYHSGTGRWLSKDPVGENGGLNLYGFVWNNPIQWVDFLGLMEVNVKKCEITILYGHGSATQPHKFKFESPDCSAGGFTGCGNAFTNRTIPEGNQIPGAPDNEDKQNSNQNWKDVEAMVEGAKAKAKTMKCCKKVKLNVIHSSSGSKTQDAMDWAWGDTGWDSKFPKWLEGGAE